jgi:uncharacterized protein YigE (DUF2233 family)
MKSLLTVILFCVSLVANAQIETFQNLVFENDTFNIFMVKYSNTAIPKFDIVENKLKVKHQEFINKYKNERVFLINSGVNNPTGEPKGYYSKNEKQLKPVDLGSGTANFYLKPNGALLFSDSNIVICESSEILKYKNVKLGVQSGAMLILNNIINQNFNINSPNKQIRCGVGIYIKGNEQYLVFAISKNPITFYKLAQLYQEKYKSENALLLESSGCAMYFPSLQNNFNDVIGNYFLLKF